MLPSRIGAFGRFKKRYPEGLVLNPDSNFRGYGSNPYVGCDTSRHPFLYRGPLPDDVPAMARLVVVGEEAWTLGLPKKHRRIEKEDMVISWEPGRLLKAGMWATSSFSAKQQTAWSMWCMM